MALFVSSFPDVIDATGQDTLTKEIKSSLKEMSSEELKAFSDNVSKIVDVVNEAAQQAVVFRATGYYTTEEKESAIDLSKKTGETLADAIAKSREINSNLAAYATQQDEKEAEAKRKKAEEEAINVQNDQKREEYTPILKAAESFKDRLISELKDLQSDLSKTENDMSKSKKQIGSLEIELRRRDTLKLKPGSKFYDMTPVNESMIEIIRLGKTHLEHVESLNENIKSLIEIYNQLIKNTTIAIDEFKSNLSKKDLSSMDLYHSSSVYKTNVNSYPKQTDSVYKTLEDITNTIVETSGQLNQAKTRYNQLKLIEDIENNKTLSDASKEKYKQKAKEIKETISKLAAAVYSSEERPKRQLENLRDRIKSGLRDLEKAVSDYREKREKIDIPPLERTLERNTEIIRQLKAEGTDHPFMAIFLTCSREHLEASKNLYNTLTAVIDVLFGEYRNVLKLRIEKIDEFIGYNDFSKQAIDGFKNRDGELFEELKRIWNTKISQNLVSLKTFETQIKTSIDCINYHQKQFIDLISKSENARVKSIRDEFVRNLEEIQRRTRVEVERIEEPVSPEGLYINESYFSPPVAPQEEPAQPPLEQAQAVPNPFGQSQYEGKPIIATGQFLPLGTEPPAPQNIEVSNESYFSPPVEPPAEFAEEQPPPSAEQIRLNLQRFINEFLLNEPAIGDREQKIEELSVLRDSIRDVILKNPESSGNQQLVRAYTAKFKKLNWLTQLEKQKLTLTQPTGGKTYRRNRKGKKRTFRRK